MSSRRRSNGAILCAVCRSRAGDVPRMIDLESLKRRFPIADVVTRYTTLKGKSDNLVGLCPFHEERHPSFSLSISSGLWCCHGCRAGGDVIDFFGQVRYLHRWNRHDREMFKAILREMSGSPSYPIISLRPALPVPKIHRSLGSVDDQPLMEMVTRFYSEQLWRHTAANSPLEYLRHGRGFSDQTLRAARVGFAAQKEFLRFIALSGSKAKVAKRYGFVQHSQTSGQIYAFFRQRIIFPDLDRDGRVLHICGRIFPNGAGEPKYLAQPSFKTVHGMGALDLESTRPVFVVESPPDRLTLIQWGLEAVATLGTKLSPEALIALKTCPRPLVFVPHNDANLAGENAVASWQAELKKGSVLRLPAHIKDPNTVLPHPDLVGQVRELFETFLRENA